MQISVSPGVRPERRLVFSFLRAVQFSFVVAFIYLTNKEAYAVYYTVIKLDGHLRTRRNWRKRECSSNIRRNTRPRFLHLRYDIEVIGRETISHAFSMAYTLINHGVFFYQSERAPCSHIVIQCR